MVDSDISLFHLTVGDKEVNERVYLLSANDHSARGRVDYVPASAKIYLIPRVSHPVGIVGLKACDLNAGNTLNVCHRRKRLAYSVTNGKSVVKHTLKIKSVVRFRGDISRADGKHVKKLSVVGDVHYKPVVYGARLFEIGHFVVDYLSEHRLHFFVYSFSTASLGRQRIYSAR